jgi:hypothetical protein
MWHYKDFWVIFFEILIFTIHYDCSFYMALVVTCGVVKKLPHGISTEF